MGKSIDAAILWRMYVARKTSGMAISPRVVAARASAVRAIPSRASRRFAISCALGFTTACVADAAEWSAAPILRWSVDQDSNRVLANDARASQGGTMHLEAQLRHSTPNLQLSMRPLVEFHRFTNDGASQFDDRSLSFSSAWRREHLRWIGSAQMAEESTLTSEPTDTGIVEGDTTRRTKSVASTLSFEHTELRSTEFQASIADVDYHGRFADRLPGYRYPSLSLSERFIVSERTSLVMAAFASRLESPFYLGESREAGFSYAIDHAVSDRTLVHVSFGGSARDAAAGRSNGYVGELEISHETEQGQWRLFYHRKLAPSGLGFLVERNEAGLSLRHPISALVTGSLNVLAVHNDNSSFGGTSERRRYETVETGLDWRLRETTQLGFKLGARRAQQREDSELAAGWRASVVLTWTPRPQTLSR